MADDRRNLKILLGVAIALLVGCGAGLLAFGITGWRTVRGVVEQAEAGRPEAEAFGAATDQQACLVEALRRAAPCGDAEIACIVEHTLFFSSCLTRATPTAGFCDGVPTSLLNRWKLEAWSALRCREAGQEGREACEGVMAVRLAYCSDPTRFGSVSSAAPSEAPPAPDR